QSLLRVADMVWNHIEEPRKSESTPMTPESPAFTEWMDRGFNFNRVAAMLAGLGVEVLAKAVCVKQDPAAVLTSDGKWKLRQHELVDLVSRTGVSLDQDERGVLTQLEGFVRWSGRYPIPLEASVMTPKVIAGVGMVLPPGTLSGSRDRAVVGGIVRKLEELLP